MLTAPPQAHRLHGTFLQLALVLVILCWQGFVTVLRVSAARPGTESYYDSYRPELKSPAPSVDKMPQHPPLDEYSSSSGTNNIIGGVDAAQTGGGSKATATFNGWHRLAAGEILVSYRWQKRARRTIHHARGGSFRIFLISFPSPARACVGLL